LLKNIMQGSKKEGSGLYKDDVATDELPRNTLSLERTPRRRASPHTARKAPRSFNALCWATRPASNVLVPRSDCPVYFPTLYQRRDLVQSNEPHFASDTLVNSAAMTQSREGLVSNGIGGGQASGASLIFRLRDRLKGE
jgi:hypothetical protein